MRIFRALAILATATLPLTAQAQTNCGERHVVTKRLTDKYGESFSGGGLRNSSAIFEVWSSTESGTWTIIMTRPDGKSCVMAAGTDWRGALPPMPAGVPG